MPLIPFISQLLYGWDSTLGEGGSASIGYGGGKGQTRQGGPSGGTSGNGPTGITRRVQ